MAEQFDVVVVGARCAGSPLAALLARQGLRVAVLERATFPHDTLSSHVFEADGLAFLDRLGLTARLRATGAPFIGRADLRQDDVLLRTRWPTRPGDVGGIASIRRHVLDPILADAAAEAGAEVRMGARVTGLLEEGGRVVGVRADRKDGELRLRSRLVVGADGRNSTIARLAGARRYNLTPNERGAHWGYFEGAEAGGDPALIFHRWRDRIVLGCPTDGGLYEVVVMPELGAAERFRSDPEPAFNEFAHSCEPVADVLAGATRAGDIAGTNRWTGFFREASGPGWVLAGDAGHFKDPAFGRGICDAFHQADVLAGAITRGLESSRRELDARLRGWWKWRDREFADQYWIATDLGSAGPLPAPVNEVVRRLIASGRSAEFLDLLNHRALPFEVIPPPAVLAATARLIGRRGSNRRKILGELAALYAQFARRQWRQRRPVYEAPAVPSRTHP